MATEVLRLIDQGALDVELERAGEILRAGGLVAFPTETVYGVAVSAELPDAIEKLYALKGRPRDKPMTMMVADPAPVKARSPAIPPAAIGLMRRFWPGPLTLVLKDAEGEWAGFRLPAHPLARGLVRAAGVPLLVPSANRSGNPAPTTAEDVLRDFPEELNLVIDGGPAEGGIESTVVQVDGSDINVLREGAIPEQRIRSTRWANVLFVCAGNTDRSPLAAAILRRHLARHLGCTEAELEERGYRVDSAGLAADEGRRASRKAQRAAREAYDPPLDLSDHRSQKLSEELVERASRIFCMENALREQILAFFPHRERDVLLLDPEHRDIADPFGAPYPEYRKLTKRLDAAASLIVGSLAR